MINTAFVTLCLCGDRCATGYHKDTKAQRKFVSDISMQSNPHNSAKSLFFLIFIARFDERRELGSVIDYATVAFLSQDTKDRPHSHADFWGYQAGDDLTGDLWSLIQLNDGQIIGRQPLEFLGGVIDGRECDDRPRSPECVLLQVCPAAAVGAEVSRREEVFIAAGAVCPGEIVSLRYAPPESGCLGCHLYLVNMWTRAVPPEPPTLWANPISASST